MNSLIKFCCLTIVKSAFLNVPMESNRKEKEDKRKFRELTDGNNKLETSVNWINSLSRFQLTSLPKHSTAFHPYTLKMQFSLYCFLLLFILLSSYLFLFYFHITVFLFLKIGSHSTSLKCKEDIYSSFLMWKMFNEFDNVLSKVTRLRRECTLQHWAAQV